ncbi:MAG: 2-succinyl-5-enolpyruvyl-6-hydroxy-3-cyclohexene-1-carboxylic-acid synthase [Bacteroidota bacterium]
MQQHVHTISQTCAAAGIKHAVICPGSRSAPLVFAFTQSGMSCHSVVDERSAAYMALGMAQQLNEPVVLICTSGTAVLNFFPAIAEAYYQKIPLLVLTADRPPELLNQQDGQMIMQREVYGKHVRKSFELPCYMHGKENTTETKKIMQQAIAATLNKGKGPVHVNIPLREPLYPNPITLKRTLKTKITKVEASPNPVSLAEQKWVTDVWERSKRKLVLVGQMPCDGSLNGALQELQHHDDVVIVCDVLSNEYEFNTAAQFDYLLQRADAKTLLELEPDCILSFGGPVLSKSLKLWLQTIKPVSHVRFNVNEDSIDTYKNVTKHIQGNPASLLFQLGLMVKTPTPNRYKHFWLVANAVVAHYTEQFVSDHTWSELHAMNEVLKYIPDAANVQVGNSSIIRYLSNLGTLNPSWIMNGNRGTSGIDGCTSTAVGAAKVNNRPTYLLTGDIAFLYDINALWNTLPHNLKIIVFNNEGGGIFQLIDGPPKHKGQLEYFTTPHHQSIKQIALQKDVEYYFCASPNDWKQTRNFFDNTYKAAVLELKFDRTQNALVFDMFKKIKL